MSWLETINYGLHVLYFLGLCVIIAELDAIRCFLVRCYDRDKR